MKRQAFDIFDSVRSKTIGLATYKLFCQCNQFHLSSICL